MVRFSKKRDIHPMFFFFGKGRPWTQKRRRDEIKVCIVTVVITVTKGSLKD